MGWGRTLLLGDVGNRLDIGDCEREISSLRTKLRQKSKNDWEAVLFIMLAKNFGLKVNGESFFSIAKSIDFSILRKEGTSIQKMEP